MKTPSAFRLIPVAAIAALVLIAAPAVAADKKKTADNVVTVYVAAHGGDALANKVNEAHVAMEADGWRFADVEIHTENGDTKGALITYTR